MYFSSAHSLRMNKKKQYVIGMNGGKSPLSSTIEMIHVLNVSLFLMQQRTYILILFKLFNVLVRKIVFYFEPDELVYYNYST